MTEKEYNKLLEEIYQRFPSFQVVGGRAFKPGLGNMMALDEALGHPSRDFRAVHIAGTNGKGSVSHMIASALMSFPGQSGNLRVGLYTSPHLVDFRERIKVDGQMVEKEWVFNFLKDHKDLFEKTEASFFEITTAMAFSYFSYRKVDVAVIECGLGGRLDSTNIINPLASVITNIGFDHMQYLGNSLEEIAAEKAGIIKPGIPAIIGETSGVERVFIDKASDCGTDIYFAEKLNPYNLSPDGAFRSFSHRETDAREEALKSILSLATCLLASVDPGRMDLKGDCQKKNIKTVCTALSVILRKMLDESQKDLSESTLADMVEAIENAAHITGLRGRWEKLGDAPLVICDIGHNSHGMKVLMPQVERTYKEHNNGRLIMFFGVMKDKDLAAEVGFLPKDAHYLYVNASTPRALPTADLKSRMDESGFRGEIPEDGSISAGLQWIKNNAKPEDFVFIGGSSYVVAEVLKFF
ncbi:MAG: bifunctional folylpolyglutamate synthase/dihydrofolate synthase [Bacteroidales bacterium]|nr:bifunctional folylpolyglutamate synthase/dihydrofolate synthase [Bacteroidales bacterium]